MDGDIIVNKHLGIPHSELRFRFARSGGRGGQNVNKVETRVELLFDVAHSPSLTEMDRDRILHHLKGRIDEEGVLRIVSQESRSQWKNRVDAVERFRDLLKLALRPRKKRIATRIPAGVKARRLDQKKHRGRLKELRRDLE
ncbi:MAG TPA: alternative ribosome rescue aminoacyl-tRNA hydrolase ArfB [Bacteroidota bacterium]|nr:alternative ribosome rescue aminoacyl-tRNA hydrolase ArfB [Bacteroidota bacterium]